MKKILILFLLYLFTLPSLAKNTILIIGDSISAGYGIDLKKSWVNLLQNRLQENKYPYHIVNASISGSTTNDGLSQIATLLKQYHPKITIIGLGGNDGLRGLQISVIKNNLHNLIEAVKQEKSKILILGVRIPPNYGLMYTQQFKSIYIDLAKRDDIAVIPQFLKNVDDNPDLMQPDGIHPNEKAQVILLDNVWLVLKKLL
ncbi:MAG: arylesterase [Gammaproteobacteria bacterium]|nr:arylesterase [Gammaproteobacteria bacterium]MCW5583855.1 arylesterase [Gammaproteobacteria bacterium]